ncbi:MAG TPA: hypothetical protein VFG62_08625 [Rhodopila sp.]|jgi:hypothetical protein|nr:hypothetical protein [Rhodopila sp.]
MRSLSQEPSVGLKLRIAGGDILAHPWRSLFELATITALFLAGVMILITAAVVTGVPQ